MDRTSAGNENDIAVFSQMKHTIVQKAEQAQVEASVELVAGLRQMVNNPDFSDVTFLCKDGKQVRALRFYLAARSDVLKGLLMNGMAESNLAEIKLPEVSSPVMLSVLEFLYTGTLLDYAPQSWKMGWEVIIASQFFHLPKLEIIVRKFMHVQISSVAKDLPGAAILLTETLGFKAVIRQGQADEILVELLAILSSNWSDSVFVQNMSEDVFTYLLVNTICSFEDDDIFSLREYLRFRQVIQWWVYRSNLGSHSKHGLMSILVPDRERVMSICYHPEILQTVEGPEEDAGRLLCDWNSLQSDKALMGVAIKLLSNIDYRSIHPAVLAKVVEPLEISSAEVVKAFRFHALRRIEFFKLLIYRWDHCRSYNTSEQGHVIYRTPGKIIGLAVMNEAILSSPHAVYEWELAFEDSCFHFVELGFVSRVGKFKLDHILSYNKFSKVLRFHNENTKVRKGHAGGDWEELQVQRCYTGMLRVSFVFDTSKQTCSLSVNDQDFEVIWKYLDDPCYYPAMSLDFGRRIEGRIRVKLVRGFDILRTSQSGH